MSTHTESFAMQEFQTAQNGAAAGELPARAFFELTGADRHKFLHNFCTNDIKSLKPGEGCEALMTSVQGKVLAHLIVQAAQDSLWIEADITRREIIAKHLNKYLITEDVQIHDRSDDFRLLLVCGPASRGLLAEGGLTVADDLPLRLNHGIFREIPVVWQQTRWTAPPNWTLRAAAEDADGLLTSLTTAGITFLSAEAIDALRIEAGFPRDGIDFNDSNLAQELARTNLCISFRKGCYLGQEPIARIDSMGHVNQELRKVTLTGDSPSPPGAGLIDPATEKEAGTLTSVSSFSIDGRWLAIAMLRRPFLAGGTDLKTPHGTAKVAG